MNPLIKLITECCGTCANKVEMLQEAEKLVAENNQLASELALTEHQRLKDVESYETELAELREQIKNRELLDELENELNGGFNKKYEG